MKKIIETNIKKIFLNENKLGSTYSNDLDRELTILNKKYPTFINSKVIMRDMVNSLKIYDKMFFIVNYDNSDLSGSHWVGIIKIFLLFLILILMDYVHEWKWLIIFF